MKRIVVDHHRVMGGGRAVVVNAVLDEIKQQLSEMIAEVDEGSVLVIQSDMWTKEYLAETIEAENEFEKERLKDEGKFDEKSPDGDQQQDSNSIDDEGASDGEDGSNSEGEGTGEDAAPLNLDEGESDPYEDIK